MIVVWLGNILRTYFGLLWLSCFCYRCSCHLPWVFSGRFAQSIKQFGMWEHLWQYTVWSVQLENNKRYYAKVHKIIENNKKNHWMLLFLPKPSLSAHTLQGLSFCLRTPLFVHVKSVFDFKEHFILNAKILYPRPVYCSKINLKMWWWW